MTRLVAAAFVEALSEQQCWDLANVLDELGDALRVQPGPDAPNRDRLVAAARERVVELLADEETTQPMGTVGR